MDEEEQNSLLHRQIDSLQYELSAAYEQIDALNEKILHLVENEKEQIMLKSEITRESLSKSQILERQDVKLQTLEDQVDELKQQLVSRTAALEDAEQRVESKSGQAAQLDAEVSAAKAELVELKRERIEQNEALATYQMRLRLLEEQLADALKENAQLAAAAQIVHIPQETQTEQLETADEALQAAFLTQNEMNQTDDIEDLIQTTVDPERSQTVIRLQQEIADLNEQRTRWLVARQEQ